MVEDVLVPFWQLTEESIRVVLKALLGQYFCIRIVMVVL